MNGVILFDAVQEVVSSMRFENKIEEEVFTNRLYKYVQNDITNSKKILKIVSKLIWVRSKEINDYFVTYMTKNYNEKMVFIDFKEKAKSSSTRMISFISGENLCNDKQIIKKSELTKGLLQEFTDVYFVDDYIGSGSTILSAIEEIKEILIDKQVHIVAYACQEIGYNNIRKYDEHINIDVKKILKNYKEEYEQPEIEYINDVCSHCPKPELSFGYNSVGAYIVLNKIAPNSDISMLWYPIINYKGKKWTRLFDREVSLEILNSKNSELIKKNYLFLKEKYKKISECYDISYNEFEFLIYTYGCYYTKTQLLDNNYFDNEEEFENYTNNLINKKYIENKNGYIIISNQSLYKTIKETLDSLWKKKQKPQKKTTTKF